MDTNSYEALLAKKRDELLTFLENSDVTTEGFGRLLDNLNKLEGLRAARPITYNLATHEVTDGKEQKEEAIKAVRKAASKKADAPGSTPATAPKVVGATPEEMKEIAAEEAEQDAPATVTPCPKPEEKPKLTKQDMIPLLTQYGNKGVDVGGIMQANGWAKLSAVPEESYQTLLDLCEKAVQ